MSEFFAGLRISASYAVVGAVISEWLGGFGGLGVYMTRVRKAYSFDKMFAVIFVGEDLDVLIDLCDRIMVVCAGKITGIVDGRSVTKEEVGLLMTKTDSENSEIESIGKRKCCFLVNRFSQ